MIIGAREQFIGIKRTSVIGIDVFAYPSVEQKEFPPIIIKNILSFDIQVNAP